MTEQFFNTASQLLNATPLPQEYEQIKREYQETKRLAEQYLAAQFTMQLITTIATLGMFWIALRDSKRSK